MKSKKILSLVLVATTAMAASPLVTTHAATLTAQTATVTVGDAPGTPDPNIVGGDITFESHYLSDFGYIDEYNLNEYNDYLGSGPVQTYYNNKMPKNSSNLTYVAERGSADNERLSDGTNPYGSGFFVYTANVGDVVTVSPIYTYIDSFSINGSQISGNDGWGHKVSLTFKMPNEPVDLDLNVVGKHSHYYIYPTSLSTGNPTQFQALIAQKSLEFDNANNSTSQNDLLNAINSVVDTSQYYTSLSISSRQDATESNAGYISGQFTVTSKANTALTTTQDFKINISATGQSLNTIATSLNNFIKSYGATNSSNAADFINAVKITNSSYSISVTGWDQAVSTDTLSGHLKCNVNILNNGSVVQTIPVDKTINLLPTTANTAKAQVDAVLQNYVASNSTDASTLLSDLNKVVSQQYITLSISDFKRDVATESTLGLITGTVTINDKSNGSATSDINLKIPTLTQSVATVQSLFSNYVSSMAATNTMTKDDILSAVKITNPAITAKLDDLSIDPATDIKEGLMTGNIQITDGTNSATVPINNVIKKLYLKASTAQSTINNGLQTLVVDNNTTESSLMTALSNMVDTSEVTLNCESNSFSNENATETTRGLIKATVDVTDTYGNTEKVYVNQQIDYLPQSVTTVKGLYDTALTSYIGTDDTKADDLLKLVNISNADITATMSSDYKVIPATDVRDGRITGVINIKNSKTEETAEAAVGIDIPYVSSQLGTATKYAQQYLANVTPVNNMDFTNILRGIRTSINNSNINVSYSYSSKGTPNETNATEDAPGKITGIVTLDDGTNTVNLNLNYTVPQLPQTVSGAKAKISTLLQSYTPSNYTDKGNLISYLTPAITGISGSTITLSTEGFNVIPATQTTTGALVGYVDISDNNGNSDKVDLSNLTIEKLPQTIDGIEQLITNAQSTIQCTNATTSTELLTNLNKLVTGANGSKITLYVEQDKFSVTPATIDTEGRVNAVVEIVDSNANMSKMNVTIPISKLPQTVSDAMTKATKLWQDYVPSNNTTQAELQNLFNSVITGTKGSMIQAKILNYGFDPATINGNGKISGELEISDSSNSSQDLLLNRDINRLSVANSTALSEVTTTSAQVTVTNDTTEQNIIDAIYSGTGLPKDKVQITIEDFDKKDSTGLSTGTIKGIINVKTLDDGIISSVPLNLTIDKLPRTIDDAKNNIETIINNLNNQISTGTYVPPSADDFKSQVDKLLDNPNATTNWGTDVSYQYPTKDNQGYVKGTFYLKDTSGNVISTISIDDIIPAIPKTVDDVSTTISDTITKISEGTLPAPSGINSIDDFNKYIKDLVGNTPGITIDTSGVTVTPATINSTGSIVGIIKIIDGQGNEKDITINIILPKLSNTISTSSGGSGGSGGSADNTTDTLNLQTFSLQVGNANTVLNAADASKETLKATELFGTSAKVASAYNWEAYDTNKTLINQGTVSTVQASSSSNSTDGVILDSSSAIDNTSKIQVNLNNNSNLNNIYSHLDELDKYKKIEEAPVHDSNQMVFNGANSNEYVVSNTPIDSAKLATDGWNQNSVKKDWYYVNGDNLKTGWVNDGSGWYNMSTSTKAMQTGWIQDNGTWYYLDDNSDGSKGKMQTGWVKDNDTWYYLNQDGSMAKDTYVDGYYLDQTGALADQ